MTRIDNVTDSSWSPQPTENEMYVSYQLNAHNQANDQIIILWAMY